MTVGVTLYILSIGDLSEKFMVRAVLNETKEKDFSFVGFHF